MVSMKRMRAGWHAEVEAAANGARANAYRRLGPHPRTLRGLADLLLEAPDNSLSGDELEEAINHALGAPAAERLRNVSDSEKTQR